jgi:uncharacterized protein YeaO (DUF488 family)
MIQAKRIYDPPELAVGARFLVERLWPRGMKKESLALDGWLQDVAPSAEWWGSGRSSSTATLWNWR